MAALSVSTAILAGYKPVRAQLQRGAIKLVVQPQAPAEEETPEERADRARLGEGQRPFVTDRRLAQRLAQARAMLTQPKPDYPLGILLVQQILDHVEDLFVVPAGDADAEEPGRAGPDTGATRPGSSATRPGSLSTLKTEALKILEGLPREGRESYELQMGADARKLLDAAAATGDIAKLEEASRRFFHTQAGYQATYRLGTYHMDRSEPLAAALCFDRLRRLPAVARQWEPMLSLKTAVCWGRAGVSQQSVETLLQLKQKHPQGHFTLAGRRTEFFKNPEDALTWLVKVLGGQAEFAAIGEERWTMFRGNPARNAVSTPACPVWDSEWQFPAMRTVQVEDPRQLDILEARLRELAKSYQESSFLNLPAAHPLVVGDLVVVRSMNTLKAIHPQTGRLVWESHISLMDPVFEQVQQQQNTLVRAGNSQTSPLEMFLAQRAWRDLTAGTLSSDGKYVFMLDDLGFLGPVQFTRPGAPRHPLAPNEHNKLLAIELESGKLAWEVGGEPGERGLDLAGNFFLGPPLPLGNRLYCLAEISGEIRLQVLENVAGSNSRDKLVWSQPLVEPDPTLLQYPARRMAGLSPTHADGVLVCPTAAGAAVGVDVGRRMLLWGYRYSSTTPRAPQDRRAILMAQMMGRYGVTTIDDEDRWLDSVPTIADGRVLLTPRDSDELHCLNLHDGELLWKQPRGEALYVAAVHDGKIILVGRTQVSALRLSDGAPAWTEPTPIPMPSGRGFATRGVDSNPRDGGQGLYHLPLSTGEIATIDLANGRILARSKSRADRVPGNLVAAGGMIVSQTIDSVYGFRRCDRLAAEIAAALEKNPQDAAALALRGELRLHEAKEAEGLADLRRSLELSTDGSLREPSTRGASGLQFSDSRARQLVVETLLEGLRLDFAKYRKNGEEIETLVEDPRQRTRYLRLGAAGLQSVGEHRAAFNEYRKLADPQNGEPQLEQMSGLLSVRSDRWVRPRISTLYHGAPAAEQAEMDLELREQLAALLKPESMATASQREATTTEQEGAESARSIAAAADGTRSVPAALRKFLNCFSDLPVADEARRLLVEHLNSKSDALELEFHLLRLRRSVDPAEAARATARLARLLIEIGQADQAADLLTELSEKWADVVCLDEKTGSQLVEEWTADKAVADAVADRRLWPERRLEAKRIGRTGPIERYYPVEFVGPRGPYFESWTLAIDQRRQGLVARDGQGKERWKLDIKDDTGRQFANIYGNYVRVRGHLMVVVLGTQFLVLDTLTSDDGPRVLWKRDMFEATPVGRNVVQNMPVRQVNLPNGGRKLVVTDPFGRPLGKIGPISDDMICYQIGLRLTAADPFTGETLWERGSIPRGSEIFGDEEHIFVVAPNATQALVLRAADGEHIGTRPFPQGESLLTTSGPHALAWNTGGEKGVLSSIDVLSGKTVWRQEFAADAKFDIVKDEDVAVFEPHGRLMVLAIADGQVRVDSPVDPDEAASEIVVQRSRERYTVLTNRPLVNQNNVRTAVLGFGNRLINGIAYGFDRHTGEKLWATPIEQQALEVSQPEELPMLVFTVRTYRLFQQAQITNRNQFSLAILDTHSGRMVYQHSGNEALSPFQIEADRRKEQIDVNFYNAAIRMTYAD